MGDGGDQRDFAASSPGLHRAPVCARPFPLCPMRVLQSWGCTVLGAPCLTALMQPWHCGPISQPAFWKEVTPCLPHILGTRPGEQGQAGKSPPLPPRAKNHLWGWKPFQQGSSSPPFPLGDARRRAHARDQKRALSRWKRGRGGAAVKQSRTFSRLVWKCERIRGSARGLRWQVTEEAFSPGDNSPSEALAPEATAWLEMCFPRASRRAVKRGDGRKGGGEMGRNVSVPLRAAVK